MSYRWNELSFDVPADLTDESVLAFVEDLEEPRFGITLARDELGAGAALGPYVDEIVEELGAVAPGYKLEERTEVKQSGHDGILLIQSLTVSDGTRRTQRQVFLRLPTGVLVATATSNPEDGPRAQAAMENLLATLKS